MDILTVSLPFLVSHTWYSLLSVFWFTILFDVPRYILPFMAFGLALRAQQKPPESRNDLLPSHFTVSIVLIGHNEETALEACVKSLREQSFDRFEIIIVSDGSSDRMLSVAKRLVSQGLAERALSTDLRGGKSSGINLALNFVRGDIVVNVDCDCSFDRYALEYLLEPFSDPAVGAVCGDIAPRNAGVGLVAQFQEIEYLQSIAIGKRVANVFNQVVCASGAFSAFRRTALEEIGGFDVGGGEDLDITIRLRLKGWRVAFAAEALCYTDVPSTVSQFIRQRLRWERDAIWIRYRKHGRLMNPFSRDFHATETLHQWDYFFFNIFGTIVFPIYLTLLYLQYGAFSLVILVSMQIGLLAMDVVILAISSFSTKRSVFWKNLLYLPGYAFFMTFVMRPIRLVAYIDEWVFSGSHRDNYVPEKVRLQRPW
ncbi:hypothetical protein AVM02_07040 [Brucella anthropi]|uniref:glycosyltransferase n=1 Tax=Brucella anthropi TaxID=529 RepID=UPI003986B96D